MVPCTKAFEFRIKSDYFSQDTQRSLGFLRTAGLMKHSAGPRNWAGAEAPLKVPLLQSDIMGSFSFVPTMLEDQGSGLLLPLYREDYTSTKRLRLNFH